MDEFINEKTNDLIFKSMKEKGMNSKNLMQFMNSHSVNNTGGTRKGVLVSKKRIPTTKDFKEKNLEKTLAIWLKIKDNTSLEAIRRGSYIIYHNRKSPDAFNRKINNSIFLPKGDVKVRGAVFIERDGGNFFRSEFEAMT